MTQSASSIWNETERDFCLGRGTRDIFDFSLFSAQIATDWTATVKCTYADFVFNAKTDVQGLVSIEMYVPPPPSWFVFVTQKIMNGNVSRLYCVALMNRSGPLFSGKPSGGMSSCSNQTLFFISFRCFLSHCFVYLGGGLGGGGCRPIGNVTFTGWTWGR